MEEPHVAEQAVAGPLTGVAFPEFTAAFPLKAGGSAAAPC